ncbi:hypothetical protein NS319_08550 [Sphingomonas sanguinis]|uniref:Uncharacterized protein n=1 Tax=Sphingomonas sanguinis TaxID=33051 RepID=A0A147HYV4_9SPHN|nr:hypothetical protein NS319_08550 [Sphingomonas sanguinis]
MRIEYEPLRSETRTVKAFEANYLPLPLRGIQLMQRIVFVAFSGQVLRDPMINQSGDDRSQNAP